MLTDAKFTGPVDGPTVGGHAPRVYLKESILLLLLLPSRIASCRFALMMTCRATKRLQNLFLSCPGGGGAVDHALIYRHIDDDKTEHEAP